MALADALDHARGIGRADVLAGLACALRGRGESALALDVMRDACSRWLALTAATSTTPTHWMQLMHRAHHLVEAAVAVGAADAVDALVSDALARVVEGADDTTCHAIARVCAAGGRWYMALELTQRGDNHRSRAQTLSAIALDAARASLHPFAHDAFERALAEAGAVDDERNRGWTFRDIALRLVDAGPAYRAQLNGAVADAVDVAGGERSMSVQLATLRAHAGDARGARSSAKRIRDKVQCALTLLDIARAEHALDPASTQVEPAAHQALAAFRAARPVSTDPVNERQAHAALLGEIADAFHSIGDTPSARDAYDDAARALLAIEWSADNPVQTVWPLVELAQRESAAAAPSSAQEALASALDHVGRARAEVVKLASHEGDWSSPSTRFLDAQVHAASACRRAIGGGRDDDADALLTDTLALFRAWLPEIAESGADYVGFCVCWRLRERWTR